MQYIVLAIIIIVCMYMNSGKQEMYSQQIKNNNIMMSDCDKGCYDVGIILFNTERGPSFAEEKEGHILSRHEAYQKIYGGEYGHINYALATYCVHSGHLDCLKNIYKNTNMMWHADLADVAIEADNLECLKFIVDVMGDVTISSKDKEIKKNCKKYVKNLDNRKIKLHTKVHKHTL